MKLISKKIFDQFKPLTWGHKPTSLQYLERMSEDLGVQIYLKREDQLDDFGSGHKLRKLEYLVADAKRKKATVLVTAGSTQSNQCRIVAIAGKHFGFKTHLIYTGDNQVVPQVPTGNYLLTTLMEPKISWFPCSPWKDIRNNLQSQCEQEIEHGEIPYLIMPGASDWPGLLGSVMLGQELVDQVLTRQLNVDAIVVPCGSSGTGLGIKIASIQNDLNWEVHGICFASSSEWAESEQANLLAQLFETTNNPLVFGVGLSFYDGARGPGYDIHQSDELENLMRLAQRYQLLFDPTYMLRTYIGLTHLVRNDIIKQGSCVILVHTGGQYGVFGNTPSLIEYWKSHMINYLKEG